MVGSPGELSEELVTQEKRKKGWRKNCEVGEATAAHGLLWGPKRFCFRTHVRKYTASLSKTKYHYITFWTLPLLLLTVCYFSSGPTYKKGSMWRPAGMNVNWSARLRAAHNINCQENCSTHILTVCSSSYLKLYRLGPHYKHSKYVMEI